MFISLGVAAGYMFFSLGLLIWCRCRKRQGKTQNGANGMPANGAEVALCKLWIEYVCFFFEISCYLLFSAQARANRVTAGCSGHDEYAIFKHHEGAADW